MTNNDDKINEILSFPLNEVLIYTAQQTTLFNKRKWTQNLTCKKGWGYLGCLHSTLHASEPALYGCQRLAVAENNANVVLDCSNTAIRNLIPARRTDACPRFPDLCRCHL